jgi:hypothetical protein
MGQKEKGGINKNLILILSLLGIILIIGLYLRIVRVSDFEIYKDSYKYLMIARSLSVGQLPSDFYPRYKDFDGLVNYKWLFSIILGFIAWILSYFKELSRGDYELLARILVIFSSVLTILLLFKIVLSQTKSYYSALVVAGLLAISGTAVIWSGFIIIDTFAALLLMLYILLYLKYPRTSLSLLFSLLLYLTRPELIIIPIVFEITKYLLKVLKDVYQLQVFHIIEIIFLFIIVFNSLVTDLYSRNFIGDLLIWFSLLFFTLISLKEFFYNNREKLNSNNLIETQLSISVLILTIIYWGFNSSISRYIVILLPMILLISALKYWRIKDNFIGLSKYFYYTLGAISFVLISAQLLYMYSLPVRGEDYHAEIAREILDFTRTEGYFRIAVGQEEAYLWYDWEREFHIDELTPLQNKNPSANTLFINDESIPYLGYEWISDGKILLKEEETEAPFMTNNDVLPGWYQIWTKDNE